jgi:hypothetical protein
MLQRPPSRPAARARRRQDGQRAERDRRYRRRQRDGVMTVTVEVDGEIINLLVRLHWLVEAETGDRSKIGAALAAMAREAAR